MRVYAVSVLALKLLWFLINLSYNIESIELG